MAVAYVRELKPTAPVARYVAPVAPAKPAAIKTAKAVAVAKAASAVPPAASAPEREPTVASAESPAASAESEADPAVAAASSPASSAPLPEPNAASLAESGNGTTIASSASASAASSSASASEDASASSPDGAKPFEWPASTKLSYVLTGNYRGEVHGSAQVEWIRDEAHYQVHLDVTVGAEFAPLFTRRMSSDGQITAQGLAPRRYDEDTKVAFQSRRVNAILFDKDQVTLSNGTQMKRPEIGIVQDSASQFVQLTWLFSTRPELLEVGRTIEVPLALPRSMDIWVYDVLERETLTTPFGALDALHLKPRRLNPSENARSNALAAEVWFAPTLQYLPVRILIHQNAETFLDLMISRLPQMAAGAPARPTPN